MRHTHMCEQKLVHGGHYWACICTRRTKECCHLVYSISVRTTFSVASKRPLVQHGFPKTDNEFFHLCVCVCVCIYCRFLVCSYHEVLIQLSIYTYVCVCVYSICVCVCVCIFTHKIILSCQFISTCCISNILHLFSPLLTVAGCDMIFLCG